MATGSLYGSTSESTGLYGIGAASGGTYFEWFVFQDSATAPPTPTGGSWNFSNNTGTPPTGWVVSPPPAPVNQVWVSIVVVDSRNVTTLSWSVPGLMTGSGLPILSASGVPASGTGLNGQLYINTATTPQSLYFKQSGAWTQLSGSNLVDLVNNQTIGGVKTFTQTIQGDISGSAGNVSGVVAVANGGTGASTTANARTNLGLGSIATQNANAVAITGGSITGITDLAVADGGTGASSASVARTNLGAVGLSDTQTLTNKTISGASNTLTNIPNSALDNDSVNVNGVDLTLGAVQTLGPNWILPSYAGNAGKVLAVNPSSSDVQWVAGGGVGSVTSVDVSGGTTGLTTSGGPITAAGVITLAGTLAVANGGTGVTTSTGTGSTVLSISPALTTPSINLINDTNGNEILSLSPVASATDYLTVKNGIGVGVPLHIQADGPSANIGLHIQPKGTGLVTISDGTDFNKGIRFRSSGSAAGVTTLIDAVSSAGHVITLPDANTTLVGRNTTDTLTNKTFGDNPTFSAGVASGVAYLNGSKVLTTGSALTFNGSDYFAFGGSSAAAYNSFTVQNTAANGYSRILLNAGTNVGAIKYAPGIFFAIGTDTDSLSTPMVFNLGNTSEQMRLTSTGLGIGTSSPAARLSVITASANSTAATIGGIEYGGSKRGLSIKTFQSAGGDDCGVEFNAADGLAGYGAFKFSAHTTTLATLDASGNLGLGVTPSAWSSGNPAMQFKYKGSVWNNLDLSFHITQNAYFNGSDWIRENTSQPSNYYQYQGQHIWRTAPSGTAGNAISFTQAMSLTAAGNLLVGLTTPTSAERLSIWRDNVTTNSLVANLQNQAATSTSRNSNTLLRISSNASGADAAIQLTDNTANNYWFGGNNGGAYVVANSNGVRLANGGTSWASDSDERVKDLIEPITNAANKVSTLRAVIGKYKTDDEGTRRSFLIAQDVQAVLPEAVFDEKGTLMLAYTDTIPLLVAAIQELKAEFDAYKAAHP